MPDPHHAPVPTSALSPLNGALDVLDRHAELHHRYRRLIEESRRELAAEQVRTTQARGIAKRLLVLVKAAGPDLREGLSDAEAAVLEAGVAQADDLIHQET